MTTSIYSDKTQRYYTKSLNKRKTNYFNKATIKHNGYYNYPFSDDFINQKSYIRVECPIHGIFTIRASNHLQKGDGCDRCYKENRFKTQQQFEKDVFAIWGDTKTCGKYNGSSEEMIFFCNIHNIEYKQIANSCLAEKEGCSVCDRDKRSISKTKTQQQFEKEVYEIWGDTKTCGKYNGALEKMDIKCTKHEWYTQTAQKLINGLEGCSACSKNKYSKIAIKWIDSLNLPIQHALNGVNIEFLILAIL